MNFSWQKMRPRALYGVILFFALVPLIVNCGLESAAADITEAAPATVLEAAGADPPVPAPLALNAFNAGDVALWADAAPGDPLTGIQPTPSTRVSLDVVDANILDVLSVLALKMGVQIIYLEEPTLVTFKSSNLPALTTFQLLLQKEGLDYLVVQGHYIVGGRDRLYEDFYNRVILTRYGVQYIAAQTLQDLIAQIGIPVESVTVDVNTQEIWVQGTPMALGKFLELIATVDRRHNAAFATGGSRIIRLPVSYAAGTYARAELEALVELLNILLHGHLDGDLTQIRMVISPNIAAGTPAIDMRYLYVEGTPDNIELVRNMIAEIGNSMGTLPFSFGEPTPAPEPE